MSQKQNLIRFKRGPGYGTSHNYDGKTNDLPDNGADISFIKNIENSRIKVAFGYDSPLSKRYGRELNLNLNQIVELRNFLNTFIEDRMNYREYYYLFLYGHPNDDNVLNEIKTYRLKYYTKIGGFWFDFQMGRSKYMDIGLCPNIIRSPRRTVQGILYKIEKSDFNPSSYLFSMNLKFVEMKGVKYEDDPTTVYTVITADKSEIEDASIDKTTPVGLSSTNKIKWLEKLKEYHVSDYFLKEIKKFKTIK